MRQIDAEKGHCAGGRPGRMGFVAGIFREKRIASKVALDGGRKGDAARFFVPLTSLFRRQPFGQFRGNSGAIRQFRYHERAGLQEKYAWELSETQVYVPLSRRPQYVIPRYRPAQATVDGEFTQRRRIGDSQAAGEHQWEKVRAFFADLAEKAKPEGGFLAILEVCGMNPWLLEMLKEYGCRETVRHAAHGAVETEDRPSRRRRIEPLAVGPSAAVPRREASAGGAAHPAADAPGSRRSTGDGIACAS